MHIYYSFKFSIHETGKIHTKEDSGKKKRIMKQGKQINDTYNFQGYNQFTNFNMKTISHLAQQSYT